MTIRLVLADDHVLVRQGLRTLLEGAGFVVAGEAADGREAVRLVRTENPDVAVIDISMPQFNGLNAALELARICPRVRLVILTQHDEQQYVAEAYASPKQGADSLSVRERQVLQLIAEGNSTKAIAARLGISAKTVESHRSKLMRKLDIHDTAGLVRYAIRRGVTQA